MSRVALFVDLPNFYSHLTSSKIEEPKVLRDYFLYWLDFDLLAKSFTNDVLGIWVFYSRERIGPSGSRIDGQYLREYIKRVNSLQGVTARDVNIPGEQREPSRYKCSSCGNEGVAESLSEKGVDTSLIVHLFDTMDSWDTAYLLSGDADFVPAVASLRRRGKIVIGVGFSNASSALVRECYDYIFIDQVFLKQDILAYLVFNSKGLAHEWLFAEVHPDPAYVRQDRVEIYVSWKLKEWTVDTGDYGFGIYHKLPIYEISCGCEGPFDLRSRRKMIHQICTRFPDNTILATSSNGDLVGCAFEIIPLSTQGIERRLRSLAPSISEDHLEILTPNGGTYRAVFQWDEQLNLYKLTTE